MAGHEQNEAEQSLPSRERGLKSGVSWSPGARTASLPSRERGLKYRRILAVDGREPVAPFTGAWIEILVDGWPYDQDESLPSRERGLKSWIPTQIELLSGRSLHGSVD